MQKQKVSHPHFDEKEFVIEARRIRGHRRFLTGQPLALANALLQIAGNKPRATVRGEKIRVTLEKRRSEFFPGCKQRDVLRIFQGYHSVFERYQLVGDVA